MENPQFLDLEGADRVVKNTLEIINNHASDDNVHFSSSEKSNLEQSYEHSVSAHAPTDAEKNTIVGININGISIPINSTDRKIYISFTVNDDGELVLTY